MPRSDGPFEILEKVGPNAYKVDLPGEYGVSASFNVADLSPYFEENEEIPSLMSNSNPPGEDDGDHPTKPSKTIANDPSTTSDAYSHMHHFYLRSTSKKKSVKQERAWELSYFLLLCEFKDFRHHEEVKQVAKI